jgi:hypothetical protein
VVSVRSASQLLSTSLALVPLPAGPSHAVARPSAANTGSMISRSRCGPLAKMVRSPALAGPWLPETGASKKLTPYRPAVVAKCSVHSSPTVAICTRIRPELAASSSPSGPLHACPVGPVGQHGDEDSCAPDGVGRAGRRGRAVFDEGSSLAGGTVPRADGEAGAGQVDGHRATLGLIVAALA